MKTEGNITLGDSCGEIVLLGRYSVGTMNGGFKNFRWRDNAKVTSIKSGNEKRTVHAKYDEKRAVVDSVLSETIANPANSHQFYLLSFVSSQHYFASYLISYKTAKVRLETLRVKVGWVVMDYLEDRWSSTFYEEVIHVNFEGILTRSPQFFGHSNGERISRTDFPHFEWNDRVSFILLHTRTEIKIYEYSNLTEGQCETNKFESFITII